MRACRAPASRLMRAAQGCQESTLDKNK